MLKSKWESPRNHAPQPPRRPPYPKEVAARSHLDRSPLQNDTERLENLLDPYTKMTPNKRPPKKPAKGKTKP
ncbi:hypothetical protein [Microcoleus sp. Pol12B5]|uniref:hypothetical protein n=1 Tax=Microcoleus sp. Pol12B5 TaxID=3055396 RepID=UPI002FD45E0B